MGSAPINKAQWRAEVRAARANLAKTGELPPRNSFKKSIGKLVHLTKARRVASFVPYLTEPDVLGLPEGELLLPRLFAADGETLPAGTWAWWGPGDTLETPRPRRPAQPSGIRPGRLDQIDLVLVPALAVDGSGTRLGQGGGWYDRALHSLAGGAQAAAVVYNWELLPPGALPREVHDIPMGWAVTDTSVVHLPQSL